MLIFDLLDGKLAILHDEPLMFIQVLLMFLYKYQRAINIEKCITHFSH